MKLSFNNHYVKRELSGLGRYARQLLDVIEEKNTVTYVGTLNIMYGAKGPLWKFLRYLSLIVIEFVGPICCKWFYGTHAHISPAFSIGADFSRDKSVVVVHDLAFLEYSEFYSKAEILYFKMNFFLLRHFSRARIVAPSNFVSKEICRTLRIGDDRIYVIPPYSQFDEIMYVALPKTLRKKQFVLLSNAHPRKNISATVNAFCNSAAIENGYRLLIVGTFELPVEFASSKVEVLGAVDDRRLQTLLRESEALLLFSISEGFGYPVVEAASFGTPTIHSETTSLAELIEPSRTPVSCTAEPEIKRKLDCYFSSERFRDLLTRDCAYVQKTFSRKRFEKDWLELFQ